MNLFKMPVKRNDLANLVKEIKSVVYSHSGKISVTEAVGALELAKIEIVNEHLND